MEDLKSIRESNEINRELESVLEELLDIYLILLDIQQTAVE